MQSIDRRSFLTCASAIGLGAAPLSIASTAAARQYAPQPSDGGAFDSGFPRQPANLVREVVGASHRDLEKVKSLVEAHPALAAAAWDWGFGDWESPLGAASHVGRREIAEYLLSKGARPDIFCAAMLGWLDVVRSLLQTNPNLARTHGPHGITLLAHARAGGEQAQQVVDYLLALGTADSPQTSLPMSDEQRDSYLGSFQIQGAPLQFQISKNKQGNLTFKSPDGGERTLFRVAEHEFHPTGARAVRLRFDLGAGGAQSIVIEDGGLRLMANRV